jgi:hypothetical protein
MKSTLGFCPRIDRYGITSNLIGTSAVQSKHIKASAVTNAKVAAGTLSLGGATSGAVFGKINAVYKSRVIMKAATIVTTGLGRKAVGYFQINPLTSTRIMRATTATTWTTTAHIKLNSSVVTNATTLLVIF